MNFDILEVFTRAWKITWKYKVLWIFGILASCGRRGGNFNSNSRQRNLSSGNQPPNEMMRQLSDLTEKIVNWFSAHPAVAIAVVVLVVVLLIVQTFLSTIGSVGLIRGTYHADHDVEKIQFGALFSESLQYFWRVIGLGLTVFFPFILIMVGFMFVFIFSSIKASHSGPEAGAGGLVLLFVGLCCCFLPFMAVLGIYYSQAVRALILEDLGVFASIPRGWEVFRKNIGGLLLMAVIMFVIGLIGGVIVVLPIYITIFPILFQFIQGNINSWRPFIIAGVFLLCYSPFAWFLSGLLLTYTETIWTLVYMRVTTKPAENTPIVLQADA